MPQGAFNNPPIKTRAIFSKALEDALERWTEAEHL